MNLTLRLPLSAVSQGAFVLLAAGGTAWGNQPKRYYAHQAVEDRFGVIAPWYTGLNGQCDFRIRVAAETLKRYPWIEKPATGVPAPHYLYNGHWSIAGDGTISPREQQAWNNGDLGQRSACAGDEEEQSS